jgi:FkbM family methyltransferase
MTDFDDLQGFLWPKADTECRKVIFDTQADLMAAIQHVRQRRVAVQAGGNCGIWPKTLANHFPTVYTFEPDPTNFFCLVRNCPEGNVIKINAALGDHGEAPMALAVRPENCGAHFVDEDGALPVLALDAFNLPVCDLLYLDTEGYEWRILSGAVETIQRCRPVIAIENKGLSEKYGKTADEVEAFAVSLGYRVVDRPNRDVILVPA